MNNNTVMIKPIASAFVLVLLAQLSVAQVVIRTGTNIGFVNTPDIVIQTTGNITTSNATDFSSARLTLILAGTDLSLTGNLVAATLKVAGAGTKTINNDLTVSTSAEFTEGILTPATSAVIKFTGDGNAVTGGSATSYINGPFYQAGGGYRFFPIGIDGTYSPATFESIEDAGDVAVEVATQGQAVTFNPENILSIDNAHYWKITNSDPSVINSRVTLGLNNITPASEGSLSVLQAADLTSEVENLGYSSFDNSNITSRGKVISPILVIGSIPEIIVKVRDLITPFIADEVNDQLYIEHIEDFDFNNVTMLDRWGVVVKRWENFKNPADYDFSKLGPGNYIVVVEFGNLAEGSPVGKISQMVTVLKTN